SRCLFCFFFQAEDGIRDFHVTGVQTCALPISYLTEVLGRAGVAGAVGAMIAGNTVGGMLGRLVAGGVTERLGWHGALAVVGGIGLLCALLTVATLPRVPRASRRDREGAGGGGSATEWLGSKLRAVA